MIGSRRESAGRANKPIPSGVPAARPMALVLLAALLTPATAAPQARDTGPAAAQDTSRATARASRSLPLSAARSMEFTVTEGSWISVDVSPDGKTIVFDLLGDLYTLP